MLYSRPTAMQRVGPLAALPDVLREFGVDIGDALDGLGIGPADLDPESWIPLSTCLAMLERSAALTACPHVGLLLGARQDHRCLGAIGRLMSHAPTLGDALLDFVGAQFRNSRGATVYLHRSGDDVILGYGIYDHPSPGRRQAYDVALAIGCNLVRALSGGRVQPVEVRLSHRAPRDRRPYGELLKAPVRFDEEQSCIVLPGSALSTPISGSDRSERVRMVGLVRAAMAERLGSLSDRVRHVLRPQLLLGHASRAAATQQFGIHPRTLGRQLAKEGTSFEVLRDEVRYAIACELLELTDLPVGDIALALSFSSHSAFVHAFHRWSGTSPSAWRDAIASREGAKAQPAPA